MTSIAFLLPELYVANSRPTYPNTKFLDVAMMLQWNNRGISWP